MSNQLKGMQKIPTFQETQAQKQQAAAQMQNFIITTRLNLAQSFLNTLLGRLDLEPEKEELKDALPDIAINYADSLMRKLGLVLPAVNVE